MGGRRKIERLALFSARDPADNVREMKLFNAGHALTAAAVLLLGTGCPHDLTRLGRDAAAGHDAGGAAELGPGDGRPEFAPDLPQAVDGPLNPPRDGAPDRSQDLGPVDTRPLWDRPPPDLKPPDLKPPPDLMPPPDLTPPPDLKLPCGGIKCPLGCLVAADRCRRLMPSNYDPKSFYAKVTGALNQAGTSIAINTDTGEIKVGTKVLRPGQKKGVQAGIHWETKSQGAGHPQLSIFGLASLTVPGNSEVVVSGKRALAIYVKNNASIAGALITSTNGSQSGSGGYNGGAWGKTGQPGASCLGGQGKGGRLTYSGYPSGGGGGGGKSSGGTGGKSHYSAGGAGGAAISNSTLVPLFGGCGGGGAAGVSKGAHGGGGGGAIQLSVNGVLNVAGKILASGGGGGGARGYAGGSGGGAGGAILLEAVQVKVTGLLAANGGGGGGSGYYGNSGSSGLGSTARAPGGSGKYASAGGSGGALNSDKGATGGASTLYGGGGGGSSGRIRINALTSSAGAKNASPLPSKSNKVSSW